MSDRVLIFDTTTRDGEQAGHTMSDFARLALAQKSAECGVDVIEAGFPVSSPGEKLAVSQIAALVKGPVICGLARAVERDIIEAAEALREAEKFRIHTFISTSDIHIKEKLKSDRETTLKRAVAAVALAKTFTADVQFSAEDATRTDPDYLAEIVRATIEAGAIIVNIPDTVGCISPEEYAALLVYLYDQAPILSDVILSVHCHNDLNLAVANSLAGVLVGARQVEGCWLGIGERAGNADLASVIMALVVRQDIYGVKTGIATEKIASMCRKLSRTIAYPIPDHQPIVGSRVFNHSSGIHRDGVNKSRQTYEIMRPEDVGWEGTSIELVSNLGRNGLADYLDKLGYNGSEIIEEVYQRYLELANLKGKLTDEDLHMVVQELRIRREIAKEQLFDLVDDEPGAINFGPRFGAVQIRQNGKTISSWKQGDGTIDALHKAISSAISLFDVDLSGLELKKFHVEKGRGSSDAIAWTFIQVQCGEKTGYGRSGDHNTNIAAAKAFVYAINHMLHCPAAVTLDEGE